MISGRDNAIKNLNSYQIQNGQLSDFLMPKSISGKACQITKCAVSWRDMPSKFQAIFNHSLTCLLIIIKSPPTMCWWRLIVFAESARRRHLFLLSLENTYSDYFQIFAVCILALGNLPSNFFFSFFSFFNKIQDGRQNPMAHARA